MQKTLFPVMICLPFLFSGCDQIGEQTTKAIEQRVQQETGKLIDKALGTADKVLKDTEAGKPSVEADASLAAAGVTPTLMNIQEKPARVASVYCTFERPLDGSLEARFLNSAGAEIGRAREKVRAKAGDGRYVDFQLDPRTPVPDIATTRLLVP
jgi:hypothetical protein